MNTIIEYFEMHTIDRSIQSSSSSDNQQSDPELPDMKSFCFFYYSVFASEKNSSGTFFALPSSSLSRILTIS